MDWVESGGSGLVPRSNATAYGPTAYARLYVLPPPPSCAAFVDRTHEKDKEGAAAAKQRTTLLLAVLGAGAQEELYDESHKQRKRPSLGQDKNTEDHHRSKQQ
ncbi:unnamed protein product [Sphagnum troendelagicum]